jgi:hypothetical protein
MKSQDANSGVIISGGNNQIGNIAAGPGARTVSYKFENEGAKSEFVSTIDGLRAVLDGLNTELKNSQQLPWRDRKELASQIVTQLTQLNEITRTATSLP